MLTIKNILLDPHRYIQMFTDKKRKKERNKNSLSNLKPFYKPVKWIRIRYHAHLTQMLMARLECLCKTLSHSLQILEPVWWVWVREPGFRMWNMVG